MLEGTQDIFECERILSPQLAGVRLIGQLPLTPEDSMKLREFVKAELAAEGNERVQALMECAPASLACFLVWEGMSGYDGGKGDYWSAITSLVPDAPAGLEGKFGRFFLQFLKKRRLPVFDNEGKAYITSILAHGGVPNSCLDDFFEHLLLPFVSDQLDVPSDFGAAEFYDGERPRATELDLPERIVALFAEKLLDKFLRSRLCRAMLLTRIQCVPLPIFQKWYKSVKIVAYASG